MYNHDKSLASCVVVHYDHDSVSNHQPRRCLLNRLFRRRSKKTSKLRVTGLCVGNSPGPVNTPHKGPVTRKMFPFDDVIMVSKRQFVCKFDMVERNFLLICGLFLVYCCLCRCYGTGELYLNQKETSCLPLLNAGFDLGLNQYHRR